MGKKINMIYIYTNEETDAVSIHECLIKNICFGKFETRIYIDWSQGYGSFVVKCAYPSMVEYNFTTISDDEFRDCHRMVLNHLMISSFSYLKDNDGYFVQFDFDSYPVGYIRMHCTQFTFEAPSLPLYAGGNEHRIPWDPIKIEDPLDS